MNTKQLIIFTSILFIDLSFKISTLNQIILIHQYIILANRILFIVVTNYKSYT